MKRLAFTAALFALSACDLTSAAIDYGARYCGVVGCVGGGEDGGEGGGEDGGTAQRAVTVLFRDAPEASFVVLRLETHPASAGGGTFAFLEERRRTDGALVASEALAARGLVRRSF